MSLNEPADSGGLVRQTAERRRKRTRPPSDRSQLRLLALTGVGFAGLVGAVLGGVRAWAEHSSTILIVGGIALVVFAFIADDWETLTGRAGDKELQVTRRHARSVSVSLESAVRTLEDLAPDEARESTTDGLGDQWRKLQRVALENQLRTALAESLSLAQLAPLPETRVTVEVQFSGETVVGLWGDPTLGGGFYTLSIEPRNGAREYIVEDHPVTEGGGAGMTWNIFAERRPAGLYVASWWFRSALDEPRRLLHTVAFTLPLDGN